MYIIVPYWSINLLRMNNLKRKTWTDIKSNDSWALFKIMSEFVEGYESLGRIGPCVSIFGSARTNSTEPEYLQAATDIAEQLTKKDMESSLVVVQESWKLQIKVPRKAQAQV